jgi:hypothetical protein
VFFENLCKALFHLLNNKFKKTKLEHASFPVTDKQMSSLCILNTYKQHRQTAGTAHLLFFFRLAKRLTK